MIQDGDKRRAHVNSVVNVRVPQNAVPFFFLLGEERSAFEGDSIPCN